MAVLVSTKPWLGRCLVLAAAGLALTGCAGTPLKDIELLPSEAESIRVLEKEGFSCWKQPSFVSCMRKRGNPLCPDIDHVLFRGQLVKPSKYIQARTCRQ